MREIDPELTLRLHNTRWKPIYKSALRRVTFPYHDSHCKCKMRNAGAHILCLQFLERSFIKRANYKPWTYLFRLHQPCFIPQIHSRGAKSRTTIRSQELPQGILQSESSVRGSIQDGPSYPVVVQQARNNMQKFEDCVLLTRVGGFYEAGSYLHASRILLIDRVALL